MMLTLCKWTMAPILAACFVLAADAPTAKADHNCYRGRGLSLSIGSCYGGYRSFYAPSYRSFYGHGYGRGYYHDTSHYDWHPTEIRRHGDHFHIQPGHYDFHRTGHWHY